MCYNLKCTTGWQHHVGSIKIKRCDEVILSFIKIPLIDYSTNKCKALIIRNTLFEFA